MKITLDNQQDDPFRNKVSIERDSIAIDEIVEQLASALCAYGFTRQTVAQAFYEYVEPFMEGK